MLKKLPTLPCPIHGRPGLTEANGWVWESFWRLASVAGSWDSFVHIAQEYLSDFDPEDRLSYFAHWKEIWGLVQADQEAQRKS